MLKHLPHNAKQTLLDILNSVWCSGKFSSGWQTCTVIPVPKLGKDKTDPLSYRPIALTSCICKVMECVINNRLVWYLEKNKLITSVQCGFCKQCSTTDHLVHLVVEWPLDVVDDVDGFSAAGDDLRFNPPSVSCSYGGAMMISFSSSTGGSGSTVALAESSCSRF